LLFYLQSRVVDERPPDLALNILHDLRRVFASCDKEPRQTFQDDACDGDGAQESREQGTRQSERLEPPRPRPHQPSASRIPTMLGVIELMTALLIFCVASSVSLLIQTPLLGALVRFRANYTPKGLQIGEEGGMTPHVGPVVPNYFSMLLRVKRIEVSVVSVIGSVRSRGVSHSFIRSHVFSAQGMARFMEGVQCVFSSHHIVV
jgi:hypothetical protein